MTRLCFPSKRPQGAGLRFGPAGRRARRFSRREDDGTLPEPLSGFNPLPGKLLAAVFALLLLASAVPAQPLLEGAPRRVRFIPQWSPQAQFAGYYAAKDKGFYAKRGLDVEMLKGGPDDPASEALAEGEADFASMFLSNGLILRSRGIPVVNVAQIVRRSALMLVAKKSSGILAPEDLDGRRVSLWPEFSAQPLAFFRRFDLDVGTVRQGYTLNLFLMDGVDAASAMWYNEYHAILNSGVNADELTAFFLADYGFNFPEDGIYCPESLVRDNPELVRDFVQASLQGWRYVFDHPEEALDMVMKRVLEANLPTNRVHQKWMLERMRDIVEPPDSQAPLGRLSEEEYEFVAAELLKNGIVTATVPYKVFYDPEPAAP